MNGRIVIQIPRVRNYHKLWPLARSMKMRVGQIAGKWYISSWMSVDPERGAKLVFEPRPDRGVLRPLDSSGKRCAPIQIYAVADFKYTLWAIRRFCS